MTSTFWMDDPNVLFQSTDWYPSHNLSLENKINALTRSLLIITGLLLLVNREKVKIIGISLSTMFVIIIIYRTKQREKFENVCGLSNTKVEGMDKESIPDTNMDPEMKEKLTKVEKEEEEEKMIREKIRKKNDLMRKNEVKYQTNPDQFQKSTLHNPFSNPLLSEVDDRNAPPIHVHHVTDKITSNVKKAILRENKQNTGVLFSNQLDELQFDQSLRSFHSIPRDDGAIRAYLTKDANFEKKGNVLF